MDRGLCEQRQIFERRALDALEPRAIGGHAVSGKLRLGVVGMGKMGLSHFAIANAHPDVTAIACESTAFLADGLEKNLSNAVFRSFPQMLAQGAVDGVIIATPSRTHGPMVQQALARQVHVFCEKPFCLDWRESERFAAQALGAGLVGQVGYHNRFVAAFAEMKRIVDSGALGRITQVLAEAYGPVVLRRKRGTWRTDKAEGGGSLFDYAAHPLNLLTWCFGAPASVSGSVLESVFSEATDDQVCATLRWADGPTALLAVNWSDESHRKMTTRVTMIGTNGRLQVDRQECRVYLRQPHEALSGYDAGWNARYTTELTEDQWFYLRGEEYSAQIDSFVRAIRDGSGHSIENGFASAAQTDRALAMIVEDSESGGGVRNPAVPQTLPSAGSWRRLFGRRNR